MKYQKIIGFVAAAFFVLVGYGFYKSFTMSDRQRTTHHEISLQAPTTLNTAEDYFALGD